jgi:quinol monooxygenase YgiN
MPMGSSRERPFGLLAAFTALPGHEAIVRDLISGYADTVRRADGTLLFEPCVLRGKGAEFLVFERYRDRDAFKAHLAADANRAFNAALALHIEGEVRLQLLDPIEPVPGAEL